MKFEEQLIRFTNELRLNRPLFYYDEQTTVCLLTRVVLEDAYHPVARGVAVCSHLDQFEKRVGRAKALGRAVQALVRKESNGLINPARSNVRTKRASYAYGYKSFYEPDLTIMEINILNGNGKRG